MEFHLHVNLIFKNFLNKLKGKRKRKHKRYRRHRKISKAKSEQRVDEFEDVGTQNEYVDDINTANDYKTVDEKLIEEQQSASKEEMLLVANDNLNLKVKLKVSLHTQVRIEFM